MLAAYDARVIFGAELWTDIGPATGPLAVGAVVVVLAIGFVLSPAGRPTPPRRRTGGFSRAIADRSDADGGAQ